MGDRVFTTPAVPFDQITFAGGLNDTAGAFAVSDDESTKLQNVDFNKFGSVLQRSGYLNVNSSAISAHNSDGLYWFEFVSSGTAVRKLVNVTNGAFYKMDTSAGEPDGTWDDATNGQTITADNQFDFVTWRNKLFMVNGENTPLVWDGAGTSSLTTGVLPTNVTKPKFVDLFNNYLFYLNVHLSGSAEGSRYYWSELNDETTFPATYFDIIGDRDGTEITGSHVLSDRLVIFKNRAIYNVFYTGDRAIPFIERKSNSTVGCANGQTIQEVNNGLIFMSQDGWYFYDGNNSYKISDKIQTTFDSSTITSARSVVYNKKNVYMCAITETTNNDLVVVWDFVNNAFSLYRGMNISSMARVYVNGIDERPYFSDYAGYTYRMDTGDDDYPAGVETAITSYWYSNWKPFGDLIFEKAEPRMVIYYTLNESTTTLSYSYDFQDADTYVEDIAMNSVGTAKFDVDNFDEGIFAGVGGAKQKFDFFGRGNVVRIGFRNENSGETWRIDGAGLYVEAETYK